jgi:prevent-host-death family protein
VYFNSVEATLTELHHETARVIQPVQAGQEVVLTENGEAFAKIVPFKNFDRKAALKLLREMGPVNFLPRK